MAVSLIVIVTIVNILRVKAGEMFSNVFTGLKLIGIAGIILVGLLLGKSSINSFAFRWEGSSGSMVAAFGLALGAVNLLFLLVGSALLIGILS